MRKTIALLLALAILTLWVAAFDDVAPGEWYAQNVAACVDGGIMGGVSQASFDPEGTVSVSQAVAIAARLLADSKGDDVKFVQGDPWYKVYADYLISNSVISVSSFADWRRAITRAELADLFYKSRPELKQGRVLNHIDDIPDVPTDSEYYWPVANLYRTGICVGDESGCFTPDKTITRAEAAAIITRILDPSLRIAPPAEEEVADGEAEEEALGDPVDLMTLAENGSVKLTVQCSQSMKLKMTVENFTEESYYVFVPAGTWAKSPSGFQQNMLITDSTGWKVASSGSTTKELSCACMNIHKSIPDGTLHFSVLRSENERLEKLAEYFGANGWPEFPVIQAAVWIITDNATAEDCQVLFDIQYNEDAGMTCIATGIKAADYDAAVKIVEKL